MFIMRVDYGKEQLWQQISQRSFEENYPADLLTFLGNPIFVRNTRVDVVQNLLAILTVRR